MAQAGDGHDAGSADAGDSGAGRTDGPAAGEATSPRQDPAGPAVQDISLADLAELLRTVGRGGHTANFDGTMRIGSVHVGDRMVGDRIVTSVFNVGPQVMEKVRSVYCAPSCDGLARSILAEQHFVMLSATDGAGRFCASLDLLRSTGGPRARAIQIVDLPAGDLQAICTREYERRCREVVLVESATGAGPGWPALEALCHRLRSLEAHVVVVLDAAIEVPPQARSTVVVPWKVDVANERLLRRHIDWYLRDADPTQVSSDPAGGEPVQTLLAAPMLPRELDRLASLLAEVATRGLPLDHALQQLEGEVEREVGEWFEAGPSVEDYTLMIALATLTGRTTAEILGAARRLEALLGTASRSQDTDAGRIPTPLRSRLKRVGGRIGRRTVQAEFGPTEREIVLAANPAWPPAVLHYVWREHEGMRSDLQAWWRDLAADSSPAVRISVIKALADACERDFADLLTVVLRPWARSGDRYLRTAAAVVLGITASREGQASGPSRRLLRHWSTLRDQYPMRWTAAWAYAYAGMAGHPALALQGLTGLAAEGHDEFAQIAVDGLVAMVDAHAPPDAGADVDDSAVWRGQVCTAILEVLAEWSLQKPPLGPLTRGAFVDMAWGGRIQDDGQGWPVLLRLMQMTPAAHGAAAALWVESLDDPATRDQALAALRSWIERAAADREMEAALKQVVARIGEAGDDRARRRLRVQLSRWAGNRRRPSPSAATLLEDLADGG